jgi:hypothetical protein
MSGHECEPVWVVDPSYDIAAGFCECGQGWIKHGVTPVAKVKAVAQAEVDRINVARTFHVPKAKKVEAVPQGPAVYHFETKQWSPLGYIENLYREATIREGEKLIREAMEQKPILFKIT